jgi:hypothetical protein
VFYGQLGSELGNRYGALTPANPAKIALQVSGSGVFSHGSSNLILHCLQRLVPPSVSLKLGSVPPACRPVVDRPAFLVYIPT